MLQIRLGLVVYDTSSVVVFYLLSVMKNNTGFSCRRGTNVRNRLRFIRAAVPCFQTEQPHHHHRLMYRVHPDRNRRSGLEARP